MLSPVKLQLSDQVLHVTNEARAKTKSGPVTLCLPGTHPSPHSPGGCSSVLGPELCSFGLVHSPSKNTRDRAVLQGLLGCKAQGPRDTGEQDRLGTERETGSGEGTGTQREECTCESSCPGPAVQQSSWLAPQPRTHRPTQLVGPCSPAPGVT